MKDAIGCEDYEKARENRDAIRAIEDRWITPARLEGPPGSAPTA
jgi:protein-arginine kinase activator protein McsA